MRRGGWRVTGRGFPPDLFGFHQRIISSLLHTHSSCSLDLDTHYHIVNVLHWDASSLTWCEDRYRVGQFLKVDLFKNILLLLSKMPFIVLCGM